MKRRVAVLAVVLAVVVLIAWACQASYTGNGDEQQAGVDPDAGAPEENDPQDGGSADEEDEDAEDDAEDTEDGEGSGDAEDSGNGGGGEDAGGGSEGGDDARPTAEPRQASDACRWQDVMVTMELDDDEYASGEEPRISLTLVNLEEQTCSVNVGPEEMEIRIMSGDDRVFSTADCVDNGDRVEELEQGRPVTVHHDWDRSRSWEDCRDTDRNAGKGTYVAELHGTYDNGAENEVFHLR